MNKNFLRTFSLRRKDNTTNVENGTESVSSENTATTINQASSAEAWSLMSESQQGNPEDLLQRLRRKEYYDVYEKKTKVWDGTRPLPPSQPAVPSDQLDKETCSSHAVGKSVVELFNQYGFDCDQDDIIDQLEKNVQPDGKAEYVQNFYGHSVVVRFWRKGMESMVQSVEVSFIVQSENIKVDWVKPKLSMEELKQYNTKIVGCWIRASATGAHSRHAVFVREFSLIDGKHPHALFECTNSWGLEEDNDPYPQLKSLTDIYQLHYISFMTLSKLVITGSGASANACCDYFGIYEEAGSFNNNIILKQKDSNGKGKFMFQTSKGFSVSSNLDGKQSNLFNEMTPSCIYPIPLSGWKYLNLGGTHTADPLLTITPGVPNLCGNISVTSYEDGQNMKGLLGNFVPTGKFSCGRQEFRHEDDNREVYLSVVPGKTVWILEDRRKGKICIRSALAPSLCPADKKAGAKLQDQRLSWCYYKDKKWKKANIIVKCSIHSKLN